MLLEVRGLNKRFGGLIAVSDVGLTVSQGEVVGLIGPNGSGKTTVFNLITGFLRPDSGEVLLEGKNIAGLPAQEVCRLGIARTFQHVKPFAGLSVWQNVEVAARFGREPAKGGSEVRHRCADALELAGLSQRAESPAGSLKLADRKRLELARALAAKPKLLLLDELMAGLNPAEQDEFVALIRAIVGRGITVVMVEHIMRVVSKLCDRVVVLNAGGKIAEGNPQEVLRLPQVVEAYLGEAV